MCIQNNIENKDFQKSRNRETYMPKYKEHFSVSTLWILNPKMYNIPSKIRHVALESNPNWIWLTNS